MSYELFAASYLKSITLYSLYVLLIFTALARASVQPWAITIIHIITLVALTAFLLEKTLTREFKWVKTPLDKPFVALAVLCLLSSAFSLNKNTSLRSIILLLNYLTIFYLTIRTIRTRAQLRHLVYLIIGIGAFLSLFGLFKYFGANPFPWWDYSDIQQSTERLSATFGNPDHLAGYMEMAIPLTLGFFITGFSAGKRVLMVYIAVILLAALILSLSRGGWFGLLAGLSFIFLALMKDRHFKKKKLVGSITGGLLAVALIVLSTTPVVERILTMTERTPETNLHSRLLGWQGVVKMINAHPLVGTGPGTFASAFTQYQPAGLAKQRYMAHNDYLHFIAEIGLPLIIVMVWMIMALYRKGFKKLKNRSRLVRGTTLGAMAGITAILIHSASDFNLHIPANALLFTVLTAIVAAPIPESS